MATEQERKKETQADKTHRLRARIRSHAAPAIRCLISPGGQELIKFLEDRFLTRKMAHPNAYVTTARAAEWDLIQYMKALAKGDEFEDDI